MLCRTTESTIGNGIYVTVSGTKSDQLEERLENTRINNTIKSLVTFCAINCGIIIALNWRAAVIIYMTLVLCTRCY